MQRPLRFIPEHSVVEVTTRTLQGRLLLAPSPELNDLVLGVIGKAQHTYGMTIHAFVVVSNHAHFLLSTRRPCPGGNDPAGARGPGRSAELASLLGATAPPSRPRL